MEHQLLNNYFFSHKKHGPNEINHFFEVKRFSGNHFRIIHSTELLRSSFFLFKRALIDNIVSIKMEVYQAVMVKVKRPAS